MTASTEQERAEFTDGAWYWVEKERWHGEEPLIAPAMYKADADAWYSREFAGISTRYLKVLEPCVRNEQAARRAPAVPVPQSEPVAYLWQHGETGRTRVVMPDTVITADANWIVVGPLYLAAAPQPPEATVKDCLQVAAPVQMPEPEAWRYTTTQRRSYAYRGKRKDFDKEHPLLKPEPLYTEHQVRELLADHGVK